MSTNNSNARKSQKRLSRQLAIAAMMAAGVIHPVMLPVLAAGTSAETSISNTATATYEDGAGGNFNTVSNTVSIKVSEVAGLTVTPAGITDVNAGSAEADDVVIFDFNVKNTGNAATNVFIPNLNNITAVGMNKSAPLTEKDINPNSPTNNAISNLQISTDGGTTFLPYSSFTNGLVSVNQDQTIIVRVIGKVNTTAMTAGDPIKVTLGNTGSNNNSSATQNQDYDGSNNPADDVYTVDPTTSTTDDPVNGAREASATQSVPFAASVQPLALAQVTKVTKANSFNANTSSLTDDELTYSLGLNVKSADPLGLRQAASLEGTDIKVDGSTVKRILVSDAIPTGTTLKSVTQPLPTGWEMVYTTDALSIAPTDANWKKAPLPNNLNDVKRIGFIYDGDIAAGNSISGLEFTVVTSGVTTYSYTLENLAQVFGQTVGDSNNNIVYDESGDANPNNYPDSGTVANPYGGYDTATDKGVAPESDANNDGVIDNPANFDEENTNSASGDDGEANVYTTPAAPTPSPTGGLYNGPNNNPDAQNNTVHDDFTNRSMPVSKADALAGKITTGSSLTFANSVKNFTTVSPIAKVGLEPLTPAQAKQLDTVSGAAASYGTDADIPDGTKVTITYGTQTAVYEYDYDTATSTGKFILDTANSTDGKSLNIGDLAPSTQANYTVKVDYPAGKDLLKATPIAILAFADDDPTNSRGYNSFNGSNKSPELTYNITIDRLYSGYMKFTKEVQILDENENTANPIQAWTSDQNVLNSVILKPGYFLEYRIKYENISTPDVGNGKNVTLKANNFKIVEDGNATIDTKGTPSTADDVKNTWATNSDHEQDTNAQFGSVNYYTLSGSSSVSSTTDPASGTQIEKYENVVSAVDPGVNGTFRFRRKLK